METETAPVFRPYPWQQQQWAKFLRLSRSGRLPHALMFLGESETGKLDFALAAARYLLCREVGGGSGRNPGVDRGCGECSSCTLFAAGSHPDFLLLQPEEPGKQLRIDRIRNLTNFTAGRAHQGGWKVVLIEPAESLNLNAANALLKTLEEPGEDTLLIMISHRSGTLLPTIRSRCQKVHFPPISINQALPWLYEAASCVRDDKKAEARIAQALLRADNRPLRALRYSTPQAAESIDHFEQMVEGVAVGEVSPLQAAEDCSRLEFSEALGWFTRLYVGRLRTLIERREHPGQRLQVFNDSLIQATRRLTSTSNLDPLLVWEELMLDWKRAWFSNPQGYRAEH